MFLHIFTCFFLDYRISHPIRHSCCLEIFLILLCRFITREEFVGEQEKLTLQDKANIAFNLIDRYVYHTNHDIRALPSTS